MMAGIGDTNSATLISNIVSSSTKGAVAASDKTDRYAIKAVIASMLGYALDTYDNLLLGFVLVAISIELGLLKTQAGFIATATLIGAVIGGIVFGILADYYGRVRVMTWTILIFAVFTGLCGVARGYWDLLGYRFMAGLGLGGEWGIGMALAAEACPPQLRARFASLVGIGGTLGVVLTAFVTPLLFPSVGWRGMFFVGIVPALVAFAVRRVLPEPQIFQDRAEKARQGLPLWTLFNEPDRAKASIGMIILCSVQNFGFYGLMIWLPSYLSTSFGFSVTKSSIWTAVTALGMIVGIAAFGEVADRIGRRPAFFIYQIGAAVMVIVYSQLSSELSLLFGGAVLGLFVNGMLGGYGALMAELYPTEARSTAQNVLYNMGRFIGGFGPVVIAFLATRYSFAIAIACLSIVYLLDLVATALLIPERKGTALD
jgi:MFS family permease